MREDILSMMTFAAIVFVLVYFGIPLLLHLS
jgi:hypothetical protein